MRQLIFVCLSLFLIGATVASAQTRHAFVVGIDTYDNVGSLAKARNDARAVAAALEEVGFRTSLLIDVDETALLTELTRFSGQLDPGDEVVFYFAGHGVEINGRNYLLPADVPSVAPGQELVVTRGALPVSDVIDQFNARGVRLSLLILDACRDNPFERLGTRSLGRSVGLGREEAPEGTFVMFSAGAGQQALDRLSTDDPNPNSVFTRVLLPRLTEPGLPLRTMVREVRSEVRALGRTVAHEQFPAVYDQLDGAFTFVPGAATPDVTDVAPEVTPEITSQPGASVTTDPCAAARADWSLIGETPSATLLEAYVSAHSGCPLMMTLATERLAALDTGPTPTPDPTPTPTVAPDPEPEPELMNEATSQLVEACVELAHPDRISLADLSTETGFSRAFEACDAALQAVPLTASDDQAHVTALLGRIEHARGDYGAAQGLYRSAAAAGDSVAAYNIGHLYQHGQGVSVDGEEAARWYRRAGENGRAAGWFGYGYLYLQGQVVAQDYHEAFLGMSEAAAAGVPDSYFYLGLMHRDGLSVSASDTEAVSAFQRGTELGDSNAMWGLANMQFTGRGVPQDVAGAVRLYERAIELGHITAASDLAGFYLEGTEVPQDVNRAHQLFLVAADGGNPEAFRRLGDLYTGEFGYPEDLQQAAAWFQRGVDVGNGPSAVGLGILNFHGRGIPQNRENAARLFLIAAEAGSPSGMRNVGVMYREGIGFPENSAEAMRWFQAAVDAGDNFAHIYIGWLHQYGNGVAVNYGEAARWFMSGLAAGSDHPIRNPGEFNGAVGRELQIRLRDAGYYNGAIDGAIGPGTTAAMQAYLDANN